jgi:phage terminase large subunit-like protein
VSGDQATAYVCAVLAGEIVVGPHVRAACQRHLNDLESGPGRGLRWDLAESEKVIRYFKTVLTVEVDNKVKPFVLRPWQCFVIGSLFGWFATVPREDEEGNPTEEMIELRRYRRAYIEIGKGNGKSPMAAGIGHYMHSAYGKVRAEVYSAATDQDQAAILFRDAVAMYERSPALFNKLIPSGQNPVWQLTFKGRGGDCIFKPISSAKKGKSGIRPDCGLIDEVHEHPDNQVIEMIRAGTKGKQDALIVEITNSGFDQKSVCGQEHDYAIRVVHNEIANDAWFSFVCSLDEKDEPFDDEKCWIKANPNLGISIRMPYIREQVEEAKGMPSKEGLVRRLNFCQWTESEAIAIPRAVWEACEGEVDPVALTDVGYPCFGGLDISRTRDLTAFTLTWVLDATKDQERFASKTWFWTPKDTLAERAKRDRAPYEMWVEQGHLEAVPGVRIKYGWLAHALLEICTRFAPVQIGGDQYGLEQLLEALSDIGEALPVVVHPQGFNRRVIGEREDQDVEESGADEIVLWMPDSINKLEAALLEKRITIAVNPVMRMCAGGVVYAHNRTGHRMFDKEKAARRIDGMVSKAMSIGIATATIAGSTSVYDQLAAMVAGQASVGPVETDDIDLAILADHKHPRWQEMRERYEQRFATADEDSF